MQHPSQRGYVNEYSVRQIAMVKAKHNYTNVYLLYCWSDKLILLKSIPTVQSQ